MTTVDLVPAVTDEPAPLKVQLPRCICPDPTTHGELGDTVTLPAHADLRQTLIANKAIRWLKTENPKASVAEVLALLTEIYVRHFVVAWSLLRRDGKKLVPLELTAETIEAQLASDIECAMLVGEAADERFNSVILGPLLKAASTSSPASPTADSTSATKVNGRAPTPMRSKQSLTSSSLTAGTGPTA